VWGAVSKQRSSSLGLIGRLRFLSARRRFELYPPYWMMRVKVLALSDDWRHVRIRLPLNWVSANAAGNMFGGFQASLADPVPALACLKLFPGYRVATKKLEIDFIRVGNSDLELQFDFSEEQMRRIAGELAEHGRSTPLFELRYVRADGKVCSRIKNTVAIRPPGYVSGIEHRHDHEAD